MALTDKERSNRKSSDNKREKKGGREEELADSQAHTSKRRSLKYAVFGKRAEYVVGWLQGCISNEMYETQSNMQGCTLSSPGVLHVYETLLLKLCGESHDQNASLDGSVTLDKICRERRHLQHNVIIIQIAF